MGRQYALTLGFEDTDINFDIKVEAWDDNTEEPAYAATTVIFNANKPAEASDSDAVEHIHDPNSGFFYGKALPALYYGDNPAPDTTPPSLSGYIFQGYYDSPELGAKQYYDSSLTPQKIFDTDGDDEPDAVWDKAGPSCTLYAQWKVFNPSNAQSNIYFQPDAGETEIGSLTFSEDDPSKSGYQGLYFRWGSLIGVSAAVEGSDAFSAAYLYIPDVSAGANAGKYYKVKSSEISSYYGESNTDIGEAVRAYATAGGGSAWGNIPSATDTDLGGSVATGRDKSPLTDASDQTLYEKYMGDICKFLSDKKDTNDSGLTKKWVMPVSNAFGAGSGGPLNSVNGYIHIGDGYTYKNESGSTPWGGFADLSADGTGSTATARLTYTLATNEKVIFPAAGGRGGGQLYNVGSYGYYWSSSVSDASYAYCLYFFSGSVSPGSSDSRTYGFPVRCVQEF
jgi:hypothetical protein